LAVETTLTSGTTACLQLMKGTCGLASDYLSWMPIIAITILITVMIIAIVYMLGRAFMRRDWEALAKTELYHTGIAVLWVAILTVFVYFSCNLSCFMSDGRNPIDVATSYLSDLQDKLSTCVIRLLDLAKEIRLMSSFNMIIPPSTSCGNGVCIAPYQGCRVIADNFETVSSILAPFIGSLMAQRLALSAISVIAFQLLLPIGLILRITPFGRDAGAFLMAIAVALYIVFPLTFVFAEKATNVIMQAYPVNPDDIEVPNLTRGAGLDALAGLGMPFPTDCAKFELTEKVLKLIGNILPQAVFFPALSMIITLASARVLSRIFMYDFEDVLH